ncbi:MAG: DUF2079 domain-containing protein, partial [Actinobacteria bacterium]|nr:DUF2079 domain-containing protein [Actinomycetota bacterium]
NTGRFDLGNMAQAVWTTAHGHPLRMTDLQGAQISRLAAHFDPILVAFAPLWWVWPSPSMLLTAQSIAVALGALPVFWLARKHLQSERAALGFALAYLLYPAVQWLTLNEFHPVALATPLLLFALWYLDEDRLIPFAIFAVAASLCKEEIPMVIAALGAWYAIARRRRVPGTVIALAGAAVAAIAIGVVIPHFNDGASSAFYGRYEEVGGSPGGILETAVNDPGELVSVAFDERGIRYLVQLVLPLALLCLLSPLVLVAAPELAINLLSATPTQTSIHFHYTAGAIPALIGASVFGSALITRRQPGLAVPLSVLAVGASLGANYRLGPLPVWRELPGGETLQAYAAHVSAHDRSAARAVALVPDGVVVSATNSLGAHLSARRRVLSFPYIREAQWIAADETQPGYGDRVAPLAAAARLARVRRNPAWQLVFAENGVLVFRRVGP